MVIASLALVATSAPDPANLADEASRGAVAGESTIVDVWMNEDASSDATALEVTVAVSVNEAMAGETDPVVVTVEGASSGRVIFIEELSGGGTREYPVGSLDRCPEEGDCKQSFRVSVTPDRAYEVHVTGLLTNDEAGCAISNPSFSDDAEFEVAAH